LWGKKDKNCDDADPDDKEQGSYWDHVLLDPQSKLVITLIVGRRTEEVLFRAFTDFYARTGGALPELITTDEYKAYEAVIYYTYGVWKEELDLSAQEEIEWDEAEMPRFYFPEEIAYATVHKERERGRVVKIDKRVVFGTEGQVAGVLSESDTSKTINTSYVERWNGTQRHINARKARKVHTFSKELVFHVAVTYLCLVAYNFCWEPRTLRQKVQDDPPRYHNRTPAMAAGLTEKRWAMAEVLSYPLYPLVPPGAPDEEEKDKAPPNCGGEQAEAR
jgi:IS1 family transposase